MILVDVVPVVRVHDLGPEVGHKLLERTNHIQQRAFVQTLVGEAQEDDLLDPEHIGGS